MDNIPIEPGGSVEPADKALPKPCDEEPFPFMDLPKDIRLMVYERLPRVIKHQVITHKGRLEFVRISRSMPMAILRTSKAIHDEASIIVLNIARTYILNRPIQFIVPLCEKLSSSRFFSYFCHVKRLFLFGERRRVPLHWTDAMEKDFPREYEYWEPEGFFRHCYHDACQMSLGYTREIQIVITAPLLYRQTISCVPRRTTERARQVETNIGKRHAWMHCLTQLANLKYSCAGMTFASVKDPYFDPNIVPQRLMDFFQPAVVAKEGFVDAFDVPVMDKDTWVNEWLESS